MFKYFIWSDVDDTASFTVVVSESLSNNCFHRTSPEFQKLLGIAMEMFLLCSDDSESDVRMVADECLNKIIKVSGTMEISQGFFYIFYNFHH